MTEQEFQIADAIARSLKKSGTDKSELKKVIAYLRWRREQQPDLFEYLRILVESGEQRTGSTSDHYRKIQQACEQHLPAEIKPDKAIEILGWVFRLKVYYDTN